MRLSTSVALGAALCAGLSLLGAATARADTISLGDFYFPGDALGGGFTSQTDGGVAYTVAGLDPASTIYVQSRPGQPPCGPDSACPGFRWQGEFAPGTTVAFDPAPGAVTLTFAAPITSLTDLSIAPNAAGAFIATLTAYDGATVVGSSQYAGFNDPVTMAGFSGLFAVGAPAITSVVISTTNDQDGFAFGGTFGIPEPAAWALMLAGVGAVGTALRGRRRSSEQARA